MLLFGRLFNYYYGARKKCEEKRKFICYKCIFGDYVKNPNTKSKERSKSNCYLYPKIKCKRFLK